MLPVVPGLDNIVAANISGVATDGALHTFLVQRVKNLLNIHFSFPGASFGR